MTQTFQGMKPLQLNSLIQSVDPIYDPVTRRWSTPSLLGEKVNMGSLLPSSSAPTPTAIGKTGFLRQVGYGITSPVTDTLAKLGHMEKRPQPVTTAEKAGKALGTLIGIMGITALAINPAVMASIATAAKIAGATSLATTAGSAASVPFLAMGGALKFGSAGATILQGAKAAQMAPILNTVLMKGLQGAGVGAIHGAHQSWVNDAEGSEIWKNAAIGATTGAVFGAAASKLSSVIKARQLPKGAIEGQKFIQEQIDDIQNIENLHPKDVSRLIHTLSQPKAGKALYELQNRLDKLADADLPSNVERIDLGVKIVKGRVNWDNLANTKKLSYLTRAFNPNYQDTAFRPLFDAMEDNTLEHVMQLTGKKAQKMQQFLKLTPGVDTSKLNLNSASFSSERLGRQATLHSQYSSAQKMLHTSVEKYSSLLDKHKVKDNHSFFAKFGQGKITDSEFDDFYDALKENVFARQDFQKTVWSLQAKVADVSNLEIMNPRAVSSAYVTTSYLKSMGKNTQVASYWADPLDDIMTRASNKMRSLNGGNYDQITTFEQLKKTGLQNYIDEFTTVSADLKSKGLTSRIFQIGAHNFEFDPDIADTTKEIFRLSDLVNLDSLDDLDVWRSSFTMAEELGYSSKASLFVEKFFPMRKFFGPSFASSAREMLHNDTTYKSRFLGSPGNKKGVVETGMRAWKKMLSKAGYSKKGISEAGNRITALLEVEDADMNNALLQARTQADYKDIINKMQGSTAADLFDDVAMKGKDFATEIKIARHMRTSYDTIFSELPAIDNVKLTFDDYIQYYAPHFKTKGSSFFSMKDFNKFASEKMKAAGLGSGEIKAKISHLTWVNEMERNGNLAIYEKDAFKAFSRYVSGASKKINYEPFIQHWNGVFGDKALHVDRGKQEAYQNFVQLLMGIPTPVEQSIDRAVLGVAQAFKVELGTQRPTAAVSAFLADLQYTGAMGFNPFTAMKNMTQKLLIIPQLSEKGSIVEGAKNYMKYKKMLLDPNISKAIDAKNYMLRERIYQESLQLHDSFVRGPLTRFGLPEDSPFAMFKWADRSNVKDAFGLKFLHALDQGAPIGDAIEIATASAMSTQFMYGIDSPLLYRTALGKQVGIFMSWPLNWAAHLAETTADTGELRHALATVVTMAVGSEILTATGIDFRSMHPVKVAQNILPIAMLEGEERFPLGIRIFGSGLTYARALAAGDPMAMDAAQQSLQQRIKAIFPGVQATRFIRTANRAFNEWKDLDPKGRVRRDLKMNENDKFMEITGVPLEAITGTFLPTTRASRGSDDWMQIQNVQSNYRKLRSMALQAYFSGNTKKFEKYQDQLYKQYGNYIKQEDIVREERLRGTTSVERQVQGLPQSFTVPYLAQRGIVKEEEETGWGR